MRFNYLGHATEQYEIFSVVPLKEELLRYKIEDTLEYFMQVECLAASDACLFLLFERRSRLSCRIGDRCFYGILFLSVGYTIGTRK